MSRGNLRITMTRAEDTIVVALVGDLDVYVASDARIYLEEAIDRSVSHSVERVVLDAAGLSFCDSTGLAIILQAQSAAAARGVQLSIGRMSKALRELLLLTGIDHLG